MVSYDLFNWTIYDSLGQVTFVVHVVFLIAVLSQVPPFCSVTFFVLFWYFVPVLSPCPQVFEHEESSIQSFHSQSTRSKNNFMVIFLQSLKMLVAISHPIVSFLCFLIWLFHSISFKLLLLTWAINIRRAWDDSCKFVITFSAVFLWSNFSPNLRFDSITFPIFTSFRTCGVICPGRPRAVNC